MGDRGRVDLVIFDCDGVLVDSEPIVGRVLADRMRQLGIQITDQECSRAFAGLDQAAAARLIAGRLGGAVPPGWFDALTVAVDAALRAQVAPVPGIVPVLQQLRVPFCVASNGRPEKVALTLGACGLAAYFEGRIFTAAEVARGKPAPDLFLLAASRMGVPPASCVVVEDSESGVAAARSAGMRALRYAPDGSTSGSVGAFRSMAELPSLLGLANGNRSISVRGDRQ
ncbi:HAD family phosphatase [Micromonospora sp. HUAS LYJ1]|uniref:HAD family hydrolase n=1 Tax=Micromonospora sp. HUAS LYJ1 TaxID=3061626 RepID=UPI002672ABC3|nr:HAD family hydrolase [Micromonospora sp. HUAS LYJ1]WKU04470.1 HAD family hydrolase [Micromonospora sp. HUAS LYJ1]